MPAEKQKVTPTRHDRVVSLNKNRITAPQNLTSLKPNSGTLTQINESLLGSTPDFHNSSHHSSAQSRAPQPERPTPRKQLPSKQTMELLKRLKQQGTTRQVSPVDTLVKNALQTDMSLKHQELVTGGLVMPLKYKLLLQQMASLDLSLLFIKRHRQL